MSGAFRETLSGALKETEAEGRGFEPPTPFGAPDFESGCWPIRLPSSRRFLNLAAPLPIGNDDWLGRCFPAKNGPFFAARYVSTERRRPLQSALKKSSSSRFTRGSNIFSLPCSPPLLPVEDVRAANLRTFSRRSPHRFPQGFPRWRNPAPQTAARPHDPSPHPRPASHCTGRVRWGQF